MKIAVPTSEGALCMHFGHCDVFTMFTVGSDNQIASIEAVTPPPHEPGLLPRWMKEQQVDVVIAGGMGVKAQSLFSRMGIKAIAGASSQLTLKELVMDFLSNTLVTGDNACSH